MLLSDEEQNKLIELRKHLHAHPELSGKEEETSKKVVEYLKTCSPTGIITNVGGHGILAVFDSKQNGETVLFRADMDALPIEETNDFDYRSKTEGVSHKCGHDGHTVMLLGLARLISKKTPKKGKTVLLFQPAEENGEGAAAVFADEAFQATKPTRVFGLHNLPGYPLHKIILKDNEFTASVKSIVINLTGKTAHAGEPENGINPALAVGEILQQVPLWSNNRPEKDDFSIVTPIHVNLGSKAYGISAGLADVHLTIRTWSENEMRQLQEKIESFVVTISKKHKLKADYSYTQEFQANHNHPEAIEVVEKNAKKRNLNIEKRAYPFKWGEDFGLFTQHYKGAFFGVGSGENCPSLHNPDYDFPDEIIPTGTGLFYELYKYYLA